MKKYLISVGLILSLVSATVTAQTINQKTDQDNQKIDQANQKTSVWKVSKIINNQEQVVYFGGTIHLLRESDFPLPDAFDFAFSQVDEVFFEVDIESATSVSSQTKMMALMMLPAGESIEDKISSENYASLVEYANQNALPIQSLNGMTASGLSLVLTQLEMAKFGFTPMGVDSFYDEKAKKSGLTRSFLESIDDQIGFLASMGDDADKLIEYTFKDMHRLKSMMNEMVDSWRTGTELELITIELKAEFPEIYDSLILNRNKNWLAILEKQFMDSETELVLVGVGHLTGDDSVINMLKDKGYQVEQLD